MSTSKETHVMSLQPRIRYRAHLIPHTSYRPHRRARTVTSSCQSASKSARPVLIQAHTAPAFSPRALSDAHSLVTPARRSPSAQDRVAPTSFSAHPHPFQARRALLTDLTSSAPFPRAESESQGPRRHALHPEALSSSCVRNCIGFIGAWRVVECKP